MQKRKGLLAFGVAVLAGLFLSGCLAPEGDPPIAAFSFHPQGGEAPLTITFDASASYDPDGRVEEYHWDFGDGSLGEGIWVQHRFAQEGTYRVILTVFDNAGLSGRTAAEIEVGISYPLDVREWRIEPTTWGIRVIGVARNIGQRVIEAARVAVRLYGKDGKFLREDSVIHYDLNLAPGEELEFEITSPLREFQIDPDLTEIYTEVLHSDP